MTHKAVNAHIPKALQERIDKLPSVDRFGVIMIENFGVFMDTHRDQPHVGSFSDDIHRGHVLPTPVDYVVGDDALRNRDTGKFLQRHDKHMFIEPEAWASFLVNYLMTNGADPRDGSGSLPTSHFRDARNKVYLLRSFRQMVMYNLGKKP